MSLMQVVLIVFVLVALLIYFLRFRSQLLDRLFVLFLAAAGVALVVTPDLSTMLANRFGVGRGADFVFYFAHSLTFFVWVFLYLNGRHRSLLIAELARQIAIVNARVYEDDVEAPLPATSGSDDAEGSA